MGTRAIIIVSILILTSLSLTSKCVEKALFYWPITSEVSTTPEIMITAVLGMENFVIDSLGKYPFIFVSDTDTVKIELEKKYVNELNQTQYIAKPEKPLKVGQNYSVEILINEKHPKYYLRKFHINTGPDNQGWLIVDDLNLSPPEFLSPPKKIDGTYYTPGCGPESFDTYEIVTKNEDFTFVEVNVKRGDYELKTISHIDNGTINVGFGMCTGQYLFKEAEEYDISFTLVNINGQRSETKYLENMVSPKWDVETENPKMYMK